MRRTVLGGLLAATVLTLVPPYGGVGSASASPTDPLAGLAVHPEWGTITGADGVLRRGCHTYTYSYSITPPEGIWAIEVFISGPHLKRLAAGAFLDGYDPKTGTGQYKLCRVTTRHGRFTIAAKVSSDSGSGQITEGLLPLDTFRLRKPRR